MKKFKPFVTEKHEFHKRVETELKMYVAALSRYCLEEQTEAFSVQYYFSSNEIPIETEVKN